MGGERLSFVGWRLVFIACCLAFGVGGLPQVDNRSMATALSGCVHLDSFRSNAFLRLAFNLRRTVAATKDGRPQFANPAMATALNARAQFDSSRSNAFPSARA